MTSCANKEYWNKVSNDSLRIGDEIITPFSQVKNLGSWFDTQFKIDSPINKSCKAAYFHLLRRMTYFHLLTRFSAMTLYKS